MLISAARSSSLRVSRLAALGLPVRRARRLLSQLGRSQLSRMSPGGGPKEQKSKPASPSSVFPPSGPLETRAVAWLGSTRSKTGCLRGHRGGAFRVGTTASMAPFLSSPPRFAPERLVFVQLKPCGPDSRRSSHSPRLRRVTQCQVCGHENPETNKFCGECAAPLIEAERPSEVRKTGIVVVQLDIANLYNGGAVAIDVVNQYPGRFENIHVKDGIKAASGNEQYESTIVGEGIVNVKKVLKLLRKTGDPKVYIIEQESYQGKTPMECVKTDLEVMKKWGY